ncbi:MAG: DUF3368 domain-containing protein [Thiotrichaceae bacterium]|nr:DUF3368 domain-containing protein [Thiotrichaceae bacterium]
MQLLISDANILIDLEEGQLLTIIFALPYQFSTPDIIYYEELEERHKQLPDLGLLLGSLTSHSISQVEKIVRKHMRPSRNDCIALVLAQQEQCPLLTGDKELRKSAEQENVQVMGTIWLVEELLKHQLITIEQARESYLLMEENGRRLPFSKARQRLKGRFNHENEPNLSPKATLLSH